MALTDNLISFWELEEASGTRNDSHGANHLTDNNTVTQETGKVGNCALFTAASSESLSLADPASLEPGDADFSIAAWVYLNTSVASAAQTFVSKYVSTSNQRSYQLSYSASTDNDRFEFILSPDGTFASAVALAANTFGQPLDTTWYFLVASYDATANQMRICVNNGTVDTTSQTGGAFTGTANFAMGATGTGTNFANARVDQVGIWIGRMLSSDEITSLYNGGNGLSYAAMAAGHPTSKRHGGIKYMRLPGRQW